MPGLYIIPKKYICPVIVKDLWKKKVAQAIENLTNISYLNTTLQEVQRIKGTLESHKASEQTLTIYTAHKSYKRPMGQEKATMQNAQLKFSNLPYTAGRERNY